jgi:hypothetical protein
VRRLEAYEAELRRQKGVEPGMALSAGTNSGGLNGKKYGNSRTDVSKRTGFGCGKKGHLKRECPNRQETDDESEERDNESNDKWTPEKAVFARVPATQMW